MIANITAGTTPYKNVPCALAEATDPTNPPPIHDTPIGDIIFIKLPNLPSVIIHPPGGRYRILGLRMVRVHNSFD